MSVVVSYWSGDLPEVTKLHFISFRKLNPDVKYVLHLERDSGFEGSLSKPMVDLLHELKIEISSVSLASLMELQGVARFSKFRRDKLFTMSRKIFRRMYPVFYRFPCTKRRIFHSKLMGFTAGHTFPLTGYVSDLAYRADLFRSLAHQLFQGSDYLYIDLDVCFIKPLKFESSSAGYCAQWGTDDSGNSAYLMLPQNSPARQMILNDLQSGFSALPWVLYSSEQLGRYGISMLPNKVFDPAWDPDSVIHERSDLFFRSGSHVSTFINEIMFDCICVHWHNQWNEIPDLDSPYDRLLKVYSKMI